MTIVAISLLAIHDEITQEVIILYAVSLFPFAFLIDWYFQGTQHLETVGGSRAVSLVVFVALLFLFVRSPSDIIFVPLAYFVNTTLNSAILFFIYRRRIGQKDADTPAQPKGMRWREILHQSIPIGGAAFMGQAVLSFPVILLGIFATTIDIADFSVASKLVFFLLSIDRAIYNLFYPLVARTMVANRQGIAAQVGRILGYLLIIALPISIGGIIVAHPLIRLVFGVQYQSAGFLLQVLLLYFLFTVLNSIFAYVVIAAGNEKRYSAIIVTVSGLLLLALVPLTYFWSAAGAAAGLALGECLMMALMYRECLRSVQLRMAVGWIKPFVAAVVMAAVLLVLPATNIFVSLAVGATSYAAVLTSLKGITKNDLLFLKERLI